MQDELRGGLRTVGDHGDRDAKPLEFGLVLPQLRQMHPAGQSPQMPVKHQQQPTPAIILERMPCAARVQERERHCRPVGKKRHADEVYVESGTPALRDAAGRCLSVDPCMGDEPASNDCLAEDEQRAWSSPIFVDWRTAELKR